MPELSGSPASHTNASRRFWDEHHAISEDPLFWMANPSCRAAINRRVTGDPNVWPLDGFALLVGGRTFRRALSLGCGTGGLERAVRRAGLCDHVTGIDFSPATLAIARERASSEGITGIEYTLGDLNDLVLPKRAYDLILVHQALHHVVGVEKLIGRIVRALTPDGLLYIDEWVGPSRDEWRAEMLERSRSLYAALPPRWRIHESVAYPILLDDPSEAIRSSAILPAVRLFFDSIERPYGGHLTAVLLSQLKSSAMDEPDLSRHIDRWLAMEDEDIAAHPERSYYAVVCGRPHRGIRRVVALARAAGRRVRLRARYTAGAAAGAIREASLKLRLRT